MIKVYLKMKCMISEDFTNSDSVNRELNSRIESDREEELRNWINQKFLIDPPLKPKN